MYAHRIETTINETGKIQLDALPFVPGDKVEIIILRQEIIVDTIAQKVDTQATAESHSRLKNSIVFEQDIVEPIDEVWDVMQ